jgi:peptide/nickel transport system substrate-binding protein
VALGKALYRGLVEPAGWMVPPGVVGFNPSLRPYGYDLARARSLLAEAGYADGFSLTLEYSATSAEMRDLAQYLQAQFKELRVDLIISPVPAAEFVDKIYKRKPIAPLYLGGRSAAPFLDADTVIVWHWSESPFGKRFTNPDFDRLYVLSTRELDPARREALLRAAVAVLHEDPPLLALTTTALVSGASPSVAGITERLPDSGWNLLDRLSRTR